MGKNDWFLVGVLVGLLAVVAGFMYYLSTLSPPAGQNPFDFHKLYFAYGVLVAISILLIFASVVFIWGPAATPPNTESPGKAVFDAFIKILPPIATLVVGFYFGMGTQKSPVTEDKPSVVKKSETTDKKDVGVGSAENRTAAQSGDKKESGADKKVP